MLAALLEGAAAEVLTGVEAGTAGAVVGVTAGTDLETVQEQSETVKVVAVGMV